VAARDEDAQHEELGREAEVRDDGDRAGVVVALRCRAEPAYPPRGETLRGAVLRRVDERIHLREGGRSPIGRRRHRLRRLAVSSTVELLQVEVRRHDRGHEHEPQYGGKGLIGSEPDTRPDGGSGHEVGLGVEIATENRHLAARTRELAVGVVEHRLQLEEKRARDQVAARELDRRRDARRGPGRDDERRRDAKRQEDEHDEMRDRSEDVFTDELDRGLRLARPLEERLGGRSAVGLELRDGHARIVVAGAYSGHERAGGVGRR
jgi:hypothetical protein